MPTVSVVMPAYNASRFIVEAVRSVLDQGYPDWELIIVDDCSTDETFALAQQLASQDGRIRVFQNAANLGPGPTRNTALAAARGRFIAFLDSDDVWHPEKLGKQLDFMRETGAFLTYTAYRKIDENGKAGNEVIFDAASVEYAKLITRCVIQNSTAMYDVHQTGVVTMPDVRRRQDHIFFLSILKKGGAALGMSDPLMFYRIHSSSVSSNKLKNIKYQWILYRDYAGLGILDSAGRLVVWSLYGFRKYIKF